MASAPYLKRSDGGTYYVHWTENRIGKRISTRQKDLADAKAFFAQWMLMERDATPEGVAITVADCWRVYDERHIQPNVIDKRQPARIGKLLLAAFGDVAVSALSQKEIDKYVRDRAKAVKGATIRNELVYLTSAINFCSRRPNKLIEPGVASAATAEIVLPEKGEVRDRWLRMNEVQALLNAAAEMRSGERLSRIERFLWIALETAARRDAIFDLTWDRVDFETGTIDFKLPGRKITKKRRAVVPISTALRPVLERAHRERVGDLVMDTKSPVWPMMQKVAVRAGLAPKRKNQVSNTPLATGISPHVLRHTAATQMARRGVSLWTVARILGNSLEMTEKVYAKWQPAEMRAAVDMISNNELDPAE